MTTDILILLLAVSGLIWFVSVLALVIGILRLRNPVGHAQPRVSVLVAARDEESRIARCLEALTKQDYPPDLWEVIVIDDNSSDRTAETAGSLSGRMPGRLLIIPAGKPPAGIAPKKNAIRVGIEASTGDVILTTDADCVPPTGWISGIARLFSSEVDTVVGYSPLDNDLVIAGVEMVGNPEKRQRLAAHVSRFDSFVNALVSAGSVGLGRPVTAVGRNFAYRRSAWIKTGGFGSTVSAASGDDDLLLQRIRSAGGKVLFAADPATHVPAEGAGSIMSWWRAKRRHISAGKRYQLGFLILSIFLYVFQLSIVVAFLGAIFGSVPWAPLIIIWCVKLTIDGLALVSGARLLKVKRWVAAFLVGEIISPFLFTILVPTAMVGKVRWKGRSLDG